MLFCGNKVTLYITFEMQHVYSILPFNGGCIGEMGNILTQGLARLTCHHRDLSLNEIFTLEFVESPR